MYALGGNKAARCHTTKGSLMDILAYIFLGLYIYTILQLLMHPLKGIAICSLAMWALTIVGLSVANAFTYGMIFAGLLIRYFTRYDDNTLRNTIFGAWAIRSIFDDRK